MKRNGDSRTSNLLFERPATTTHRRHQPLIDPMVLMILILPILVLLFLFFLSYVPKSIKPTSFKSTFNLFNLFLVLLVNLFCVLHHEDNESPTNRMVESYQDQDGIGVNDESPFYDADEDWSMSDEVMDVAVNSDDQRTSTPPPVPWMHANYNKLDRQVNEDTTERGSSDDQSYRNQKRKLPYRRKVKNKKRFAPYIPPAPPPPPKAQAQAPTLALADISATTPTPFIKNLKKMLTPKNKNKKHPSSKTSKLPPRPRPTPQPQPEPEPPHYDRQSSISSNSESSYTPQPPPPPPFDMLEMRYKYYGDHYVRLRSFNSNTSSSSDIQPIGQPSSSMDGGDSFGSSPDVNAKAGIFISKGKDKWKVEQENIVKKKGGPSSFNKPKINEK